MHRKLLGKGSSGKRFEVPKCMLKLFFLLKIIKSNILNVKGLANEDDIFLFVLIFLENIKIQLYLNLFPLEPFS